MSNTNEFDKNNLKKYNCSFYTTIDEVQIKNIKQNYTVLDVNSLDMNEVNSKMMNDTYFKTSPKKKEVVNNILDYHLNSKDVYIYKITDYLCNKKEKICICNHAEDLKKIYGGTKHGGNEKYVSWCKKDDEYF